MLGVQAQGGEEDKKTSVNQGRMTATQKRRMLRVNFFWEVLMDEFDDVPVLTADEILCCLGFGLLAVGMLEGVLFMAVPVMRWGYHNIRAQWESGAFAKIAGIRLKPQMGTARVLPSSMG
jgi:hypothetical protein